MANDNDDKGKCAEATICVRCKHVMTGTKVENHKCEAHPIGRYVTGTPGGYGYCENWNTKGQCPDYEERGDDG